MVMPKKRIKKELYTLPEVAELKGCSRIAVFQAVQDGKLPAFQVGRSWLVKAEDLAEWNPQRGPGADEGG